jgi:ankyrin repeat protein
MKAKVFIGVVFMVAAVLLVGAFAPGIQSRVFRVSENRAAALEPEADLERIPAPTPTPTPELSPREKAVRKLGWLQIEVVPESLHRAAARKEYYATGLLLAAGVDVDALDERGRTPLLIALQAEDGKMVDQLLESGADVNLSGPGEASPLMTAAMAGNLDRMTQLLEAGARFDATDAKGRSILFRMVEEGRLEELNLLLEAGADPKRPGPDGELPLEVALRLGHAGIARTLFALEPEPRAEWTPFMREKLVISLKSGDRETASLLLAHHQDVPKPEGSTQTLLAYAIAWEDLDTFKTLLACGADPNQELTIPAEQKFIDAVNGGELTFYLQNEQGMTVLMLAAGLGRLEFVEELLNYGANKSARTAKYKMVAMNFAQRANRTRTILLMLGKDPDPSTHTTRIAISLSNQQAVYYQEGTPVFRTPVSTGKRKYRTPTGDFVITDKQRSRISSIYNVEMPYFMRLNGSGYGMHAGYVPDYPASHGCIRLPRAAARRLFKDVEVGTYVTISD